MSKISINKRYFDKVGKHLQTLKSDLFGIRVSKNKDQDLAIYENFVKEGLSTQEHENGNYVVFDATLKILKTNESFRRLIDELVVKVPENNGTLETYRKIAEKGYAIEKKDGDYIKFDATRMLIAVREKELREQHKTGLF